MVTTIQVKPEVSQRILLQGISWGTYEALVRELESQPGKRMTYDNGILEIFMPLPPHERYKRWGLGGATSMVQESSRNGHNELGEGRARVG